MVVFISINIISYYLRWKFHINLESTSHFSGPSIQWFGFVVLNFSPINKWNSYFKFTHWKYKSIWMLKFNGVRELNLLIKNSVDFMIFIILLWINAQFNYFVLQEIHLLLTDFCSLHKVSLVRPVPYKASRPYQFLPSFVRV